MHVTMFSPLAPNALPSASGREARAKAKAMASGSKDSTLALKRETQTGEASNVPLLFILNLTPSVLKTSYTLKAILILRS